MNVLRSDFMTKQKRLKGRRQRGLTNFFTGYHTVSNLAPSAGFLNLTLPSETKTPNRLTTPQNLSSASRYNDSVGVERSIFNGQSFYGEGSKSSISETAQESTDSKGQGKSNAISSSSLEFQKLMTSFQNLSKFEETDDNCSSGEEVSEPVFKKPRPVTLERHSEDNKKNKIASKSEDSPMEIFKKYNVFDLPVQKNQFNFEEIMNRQALLTGSPSPAALQTPKLWKNKSSSSSSEHKTPKNKIGKSPKSSGSGKLHNSDTAAYILAVTEGRGQARGEVGIAGMDPKRPHLFLSQISDSQRYIHTLTKMNIFDFVEVIVPNTFVDCPTPNKLYSDIRSRFPTVTLTSVQRRHFNEEIGLEFIKQYISPESTSVMVLLRDKFYALSAAAALMKYIEFTQNVHLAPQSLRIEYQGTEDTMLIDLDTASRLELVMCINHPETNSNDSLLGVVKHCRTKGGVRLMRANILQPPCSLTKIQSRLDCVAELVGNPLLFCALESAVNSFTNLESLLNLCMHAPQQDGLRVAEYQLKYTLLLKTVLELLPVLIASLENAKSDFFCEVREHLSDARYGLMLERILQTVFENAKTVKGSVAAHLHGCFAIKAGVNSLLDIAKKTYCEIVQDISDHITKLRETHNMPLRISFSGNKGFHIQYTLPHGQRNLKESDLPKEFILVQKTKSTFSFYTAELVALDQRSHHVLNEIKLMTNVVLFELLTDIRQHIGCLFNLCEYIAELDVLLSFAQVSSGTNFVRPKFGDELNLKDSRHPILDVVHVGEVVPNDIFAKNGKNFTILTGPNQSGKSIYIRQIALLQIMAQIGCYVPAVEATFRLTDRIFSRIGFDDSIESNASTLIVEMRDIDYLKHNITSKSLVIIDELCRGTSVEEGTCLAFAICEQLLDTSAFVFFTTHYLFLTKLEEMYYNVTNYHFETKLVGEEKPRLQFSYLKKPGVTKAEEYGLRVAELTSFPKDVLMKAGEISAKLVAERKPSTEIKGLLARYQLSLKLESELNKCGPDMDWTKMKPVILRFKELYSDLTSTEELENEKSTTSLKSSSSSVERSMKKKRTKGSNKEKQIVLKLSRKIKKKYCKILKV